MLKKAVFRGMHTLGLAKPVLKLLLKGHNLTYRYTGSLSQLVESDGLHPKHRLMDYHQWFVRNVQPQWRALDIGCGNGALTLELAENCQAVTGIDLEIRNIEEARKRVPNANARFVCDDATTYLFEEEFDVITLSNVLEHIEFRVEFLKKLHRLSSRLLVRVPLIDRDWITLYKQELGVEYRLDPTHYIEYTVDGLREELVQAGGEISEFRVRFAEVYAQVRKE